MQSFDVRTALRAAWSTHADRTAITQGTRCVTYAQIMDTCETLRKRMGGSRFRTALVDRSDIQTRVIYLALLAAGHSVVPISPQWPSLRTASALELAEVDCIFDSSHFATTKLHGDPEWRQSAPRRTEPTSDIAYVLFTSGSTGKPKGVPVAASALASLVEQLQSIYNLSTTDRLSATFALTFDVSVFDTVLSSLAGASLHLPTEKSEILYVGDYVRRASLTHWFSVPSVIGVARELGQLTPASLSTVRRSSFAGEPLLLNDARDWKTAATRSSIENLYGPTEATVVCTRHVLPDDLKDWPSTSNGTVPIGRPFSSVSWSIGSDRSEREFRLRGEQVFSGYLGAEHSPFEADADGIWYLSGDAVAIEQGDFVHLGRIDRQVKVSGYRVELAEVEHAIRRSGAADVAVIAIEEAKETILVAFVVTSSPDETRTRLADEVPPYMVPSRIFPVDSLPRLENGKTDYRSLTSRSQVRT